MESRHTHGQVSDSDRLVIAGRCPSMEEERPAESAPLTRRVGTHPSARCKVEDGVQYRTQGNRHRARDGFSQPRFVPAPNSKGVTDRIAVVAISSRHGASRSATRPQGYTGHSLDGVRSWHEGSFDGTVRRISRPPTHSAASAS